MAKLTGVNVMVFNFKRCSHEFKKLDWYIYGCVRCGELQLVPLLHKYSNIFSVIKFVYVPKLKKNGKYKFKKVRG